MNFANRWPGFSAKRASKSPNEDLLLSRVVHRKRSFYDFTERPHVVFPAKARINFGHRHRPSPV